MKKTGLNRYLVRSFIDYIKSIKLYKYYSSAYDIHNCEEEIIVMFDGKLKHGGISDRLWGMISIYKFCKEKNIKYKIFFNHPFKLQNFLIPNKVDWIISKEDIIYDRNHSLPQYISMVTHDPRKMYRILEKKLNNRKQQHIYTNTRIIDKKEFSSLFHELFRLNVNLSERLSQELLRMTQPYVSCTFRFQQLLGDFKEGNFKVIENLKKRDDLINKCKWILRNLHDYTGKQILVTSDSLTFLKSLEKMEYVNYIEGEIVHPDYDNTSAPYVIYLKSFIDLFMIANAESVYLCNAKPLYRSGFPETAACINNRPYYEILDFENFNIVKI